MVEAWLCQQIVTQAPDAIIMADREGVIRLWNQGAEAVFGFQAAEALGQSLHLIIPENLRSRHDDSYKRVMQTGQTRYASDLLAVPALHKDGRRLSVEFTVTLIKNPAGQIQGAAAIIRDVTARWERDRALQRRLADLTAQSERQADKAA